MMHRNAAPLRKADKERMAKLHNLPCIACMIDKHDSVCGPSEAHHIKSGNKRIGHQDTVVLGSWHHRSIPLDGHTHGQMELIYGPSLARTPKRFRERYGEDRDLVALTDEQLERNR